MISIRDDQAPEILLPAAEIIEDQIPDYERITPAVAPMAGGRSYI